MGRLKVVDALQGAVRAWVFPVRCPVCGELGAIEDDASRGCADCIAALPRLAGRRCLQCKDVLRDDDPVQTFCPVCRIGRYFQDVWAPFAYAPPMDRIIYRIKFGGELALATWLARWVPPSIRTEVPATIVPIPLGRLRHARRGFNQAEILAREIGRATGWPVRTDLLRRVRSTPAQARLGLAARIRNVEGAFALQPNSPALTGTEPDVAGRFLLVDDVMTTGATVGEAARTLRQRWPDAWVGAAVAVRATSPR